MKHNLRILSGKHRGLSILLPSAHIRPTKIIIRTRIWDILIHNFTINSFMDCFAGSGVMGLEAISRGIQKVVFVDQDQRSINCINQILQKLACQSDHPTLCVKVSRLPQGQVMDVVFLDPPYHNYKTLKGSLQVLYKQNWINNKTLIVFETSKHTDNDFIQKYLTIVRSISVGYSIVYFGYYIINK